MQTESPTSPAVRTARGADDLPDTGAPDAPGRPGLDPADELVLSFAKRMVVQYMTSEAGGQELHLFYGAKDISFDEPECFGFGETLATQSRFVAGSATRWGAGLPWSRVRPLLEYLLDEGVLLHARDVAVHAPAPGSMVRPSPLPPSVCPVARTWHQCEAITEDLTGRPVEVGHLELIVPIFRVAHIAVDADGRQVGEANVFPRALRLDTPTTWLTCAYPGTRHMSDRPMNVTALKAMRLHWTQMMAVLLRVRAAYLARCPDAADGWTVGRVERLATLVLALPTYQLVRCDRPLENGQLHPVLSSLFRVTDGLRMTMHQMLFVPIGEPALSPDAPLTSEQIFEYAERNYSFHSETGVCGGPKHMIQEFLRVLLEGEGAKRFAAIELDAPVADALADMDQAFDYGLYGLQAYAAVFSLWPAMARAYEQIATAADDAVEAGAEALTPLRDRLRAHVRSVRTGTYLATEQWRLHREAVYADMDAECGRALRTPAEHPSLTDRLTPTPSDEHREIEATLERLLQARFGVAAAGDTTAPLRRAVRDFFTRQQAVCRAAEAVQARINRLLGRPAPTRPFGAAEADVHNLLQGAESRRLPYLVDELEDALDIHVRVDAHRISLAARAPAPERSA